MKDATAEVGNAIAMMATAETDRAGWMRDCTFGLMAHWLFPQTTPEQAAEAASLNAVVESFDLERFLADFDRTGADFLMFTIGQNSGYYASPNALLDSLAEPGRCSRRDLILELAQAMRHRRKRFIAYLPSEVHFQPEEIQRAFVWDPSDQRVFQQRYTRFIQEWSERLGELLDGWWFDGCYEWEPFPNQTYDWPLWCAASRAGNPTAAVAFNDGSFFLRKTRPVTPYQDYLSGEVGAIQQGGIRLGRGDNSVEEENEARNAGEEPGKPALYYPEAAFVPGTHCQWHAQVPIDERQWVHSHTGPMAAPRYSDSELLAFLERCKAAGGAVTLNVGIYREGHLGAETVAQLERVSSLLSRSPTATQTWPLSDQTRRHPAEKAPASVSL